MNLKNELNEKQLEAVTTSSPYVRIIAGAGSGKTRVLTYRIAFLICEMKANPRSIVAITFTNKVAKEMKERVQALLERENYPFQGLTISTFHSFCARFLREEIYHLRYPTNFTIIDDEDQEKLIKELAAEEYSVRKSDPLIKQAISYICSNKTEGILPDDLQDKKPSFEGEKECIRLFTLYENKLFETGNLDFDDLLLKTIQILEQFPDVKEKWRRRIDHILIDEFQDTNDIQYRLIQLLKKPDCSLYVVGDPDQTIYTWRGANQDIILDIHQRYQMETIVLDQNYRSTQTILDTANRLILHNKKRVKKDLFTQNGKGNPILFQSLFRAEDEANWVADQIEEIERKTRKSGEDFSYNDIAILYRSSYLTLPFEKVFNRRQMPYRIFGGIRFYQRKEIKDVLAYFSLLINPKNDIALTRILNVPKRSVGPKAEETLKQEAKEKQLSLYEYISETSVQDSSLRPQILQSLKAMIQKVEDARTKLNQKLEAYSAVLKDYITSIGYEDYLLLEEEEGKERIDNVRSLFDDITSFINANPESGFQDYMENVSLQSGQDEMVDGDFITMMTVHTAKGLEFPYVFVVGLNEGVFPSMRTLEENPVLGLEEERRLCYVAFTRAMKELFVSCNREFSYVANGNKVPSRFFKEAGLIFQKSPYSSSFEEERPKKKFVSASIQRGAAPKENGVDDWRKGDLVQHDSFGEGIVMNVINNNIIEVMFKTVGKKTLLATHPALHRIKKGGFDA